MEFTIKLTSRGGGIGQVQVLINGKEFVATLPSRSVGQSTGDEKQKGIREVLRDVEGCG